MTQVEEIPDRRTCAVQLVALKVMKGKLKHADDIARFNALASMDAHERVPAKVGDEVIGTVTITAPKAVVCVTDAEALSEWTAERYPENVETIRTIIGTDAEVLSVLETYAPHLVRSVQRIAPWAVEELKTNGEVTGKIVGPGGELDVPGVEYRAPLSVPQVRTTAEAERVITDLLAAGRVRIDGTVRLALPGGEA